MIANTAKLADAAKAGRHAYRRGDVIAITLTAPGYLAERAQFDIRNGRRPRGRT
jgi:hypothetical protein